MIEDGSWGDAPDQRWHAAVTQEQGRTVFSVDGDTAATGAFRRSGRHASATVPAPAAPRAGIELGRHCSLLWLEDGSTVTLYALGPSGGIIGRWVLPAGLEGGSALSVNYTRRRFEHVAATGSQE